MRLPIPYSPSTNQIRNSILDISGTKISEENQWVTKIIESFYQNLGYTQVTKNFGTQLYDTWIFDGNKEEKVLGSFKELYSYPYNPHVFEIGDYLSFDYGGDTHNWLITSLDKQLYYNVNGRIERCNISLKWKDTANIISYPAVARDELKRALFDFNKYIITPQGYLHIDVQVNSDTENIKINQRFLFGYPYQAFKVTALINYTDTNTMGLELMVDQISPEDNLDLGIANYSSLSTTYTLTIDQGSTLSQSVNYTSALTATLKLNNVVVTDQPITWTSSNPLIGTINPSTGIINLISQGSVTFTASMANNPSVSASIAVTVASVPAVVKVNSILPNVTSILQGTTNAQIYNVYHYINNVVDSNTFTIVPSGVSSAFYNLQIIDGNHFSVTSLGYTSTKLLITCTNNIDATTTNISISLKGLY